LAKNGLGYSLGFFNKTHLATLPLSSVFLRRRKHFFVSAKVWRRQSLASAASFSMGESFHFLEGPTIASRSAVAFF
jgi:hypothetical protein